MKGEGAIKTAIAAGLLSMISLPAISADQTMVDRYNKACVVCHSTGVANAPKAFNTADWQPRLVKGMDKLLVSVKNGLNAMPPKAMCNDCSDADYRALIQYMSSAKK